MSNKQEVVTLGFLQVLTRGATPEDYLAEGAGSSARATATARTMPTMAVLGTTYQRTALAEWLTDVDHGAGGLLARVIVNRLWQHHFGEGLVRTPDDFGTTGDQPDHPELLDWLAGELIRGGWRLKPIHRLIVTSAAYRQATAGDPAGPPSTPKTACSGTAARSGWRPRPSATRCSPRAGA